MPVGRPAPLLLGSLAIAVACAVSAAPALGRSDGGELAQAYWSSRPNAFRQPQLVSAEVPVVGCPVSGMADDVAPPRTPPSTRVLVPQGAAASLAYFTTREDASRGVLGPRSWSCHGQSGSDGDVLYVVPGDAVLDQENGGYKGPMVRRRVAEGSTSGRFEVARVAGRIFPQARRFAEGVRSEGMDEPGTYAFTSWPSDRVERLDDGVAAYATPGGAQGTGRQGKPPYGPDETTGVVVFETSSEGDPYLLQLDVRLGGAADLPSTAIVTAFLARLNRSVPAPQPAAAPARAAQGPSADAIVRSFYEALARADGRAAAELVVPERRTTGPYAPEAISRFYSTLSEPLRVISVRSLGGDAVEVRYRYRKPSGVACDGVSVATVVRSPGGTFISRIKPSNGC